MAIVADRPYRVMVVDDSAVIRGLLTRTLETDTSIEVVVTAPNGQMALRALTSHDIEVVVLDIEMPVMDGLAALPKLIEAQPGIQVIMASTLTRQNADISLRALQAGAADYIAKPSSNHELHSADDFKRDLTDKVKALGSVARQATQSGKPAISSPSRPAAAAPATKTPVARGQDIELRKGTITTPDVIAIGSSTGGPQALLALLGGLSGHVKQPVLITQHMPATFTALLAEHIARATSMPCSEGEDGQPVLPGHIYVAPGGFHMVAVRDGAEIVIRLNQDPPENFCRPAVDPMLRSLSKLYGARLLTIILTGMGSDGKLGCQEAVAGGGTVIAQDEASSVVWGMPGAVATAGLCSAVLPLNEISDYTRKLLMRSAA